MVRIAVTIARAVLLFAAVGLHDRLQRAVKVAGEDGPVAGRSPVDEGEHDRPCERIDFPFALEDVIPRVESVGVSVGQHVASVALYHPVEARAQYGVRPLEANVGNRLSRRIAQPHRRNVAGLDVRRRIVFQEKVVEQRVKELRRHDVADALSGQRNDERLCRGGWRVGREEGDQRQNRERARTFRPQPPHYGMIAFAPGRSVLARNRKEATS